MWSFFCLQVVQTVETVNFSLLQTVETVNFHRIALEGALRQKVNDGKEGLIFWICKMYDSFTTIDLIQHQNFQDKRNPFHGRFMHKPARFWYGKLMNIWRKGSSWCSCVESLKILSISDSFACETDYRFLAFFTIDNRKKEVITKLWYSMIGHCIWQRVGCLLFAGVARACAYAQMIFTAVSKRDAVS